MGEGHGVLSMKLLDKGEGGGDYTLIHQKWIICQKKIGIFFWSYSIFAELADSHETDRWSHMWRITPGTSLSVESMVCRSVTK